MKPIIEITLNETLTKHKLSRNAVAVEGKIRPATIGELVQGQSKSISFETLTKIIQALNTLTGERHTIDNVIKVTYESDKQ